jgi:hypothetical protein
MPACVHRSIAWTRSMLISLEGAAFLKGSALPSMRPSPIVSKLPPACRSTSPNKLACSVCPRSHSEHQTPSRIAPVPPHGARHCRSASGGRACNRSPNGPGRTTPPQADDCMRPACAVSVDAFCVTWVRDWTRVAALSQLAATRVTVATCDARQLTVKLVQTLSKQSETLQWLEWAASASQGNRQVPPAQGAWSPAPCS